MSATPPSRGSAGSSAAPPAPDPVRDAAEVAPVSLVRTLKGNKATNGAGFVAGLVLYAILLNLIRNGPAGAKAWLAAKFLNETGSAPASSTSTPSAPAPAGGGRAETRTATP